LLLSLRAGSKFSCCVVSGGVPMLVTTLLFHPHDNFLFVCGDHCSLDAPTHLRVQLTLVEAPNPWGPFSIFFRDDDWSGDDGSTGGYTPVFPPAWIGEDDFWLVFTQCCGNARLPLNNYNFNAQHVTLKMLGNATVA
jgi:hypothetical protein